MDWNNRPHIVHKWQPFGIQQMQIQQPQQQQQIQQQQQQQQHQITVQQQHPQQQQQQQQIQQQQQQQHQIQAQVQVIGGGGGGSSSSGGSSGKVSRGGGSSIPHCLVCNVHLGMFAKGGMEIFSDKVTTTYSKLQVHHVLGSIVSNELNVTGVHSSIVCKKCYKLINDIDALEVRLGGMKQLVSSKYTMTLSLVKRGLVGKAVVEETLPKQQQQEEEEEETTTTTTTIKDFRKAATKPIITGKGAVKIKEGGTRRGRPPKLMASRKFGKLEVKSGKLVVKGGEEAGRGKGGGNLTISSEDELEEDSVQIELDIADDNDGAKSGTETGDGNTCYYCGKEFSSRAVLMTHVETHGINCETHKCNVCLKTFLTPESLVKHKALHKGKKKITKRRAGCPAFDITHIKQFKCRLCSKVFTTKSKAEDHERTHTGEKPFECDICGTCFRQKSNLSSHKRVTHLQEKRYRCEICDKAFKWKRLLVGHTMSVHTGERPYKCEFCDAGFVYQQHYKKHMRIHTGEKPFSCKICGKAFNSSNNCRAHMFTHSDKKPYECIQCGTGFMRKPLALAHIKQHHGHLDTPDMYIKTNSPTVALGEGSAGNVNENRSVTIPTPRKKKTARDQTHAAVMEIQAQPQTVHGNVEESIQHFIIPSNDGREGGGGEAMGYMFGTFQTQATVNHYTPLNLGQW